MHKSVAAFAGTMLDRATVNLIDMVPAVGIEIVVFCSFPVPSEDSVIAMLEPLEQAGFHIVLIVDQENTMERRMSGYREGEPYAVVEPPAFMGPRMDSVEQIVAWIARVKPGCCTFGVAVD